MSNHRDLWLMAGGYLWPPGSRPQWVQGIDLIALDMILAGVTIRWGRPATGKLASCAWWCCRITLDPELVEYDHDAIRDLLAHELAHCLAGPSCIRARLWQQQRYREMLTDPAWLAA